MKPYGKELVLDIYDCQPARFTRTSIRKFFKELCDLIEMERCKLTWWDDHGLPIEEQETEPHLKGTTAVQFIKTSNITIHSLDLLKRVYLNIFSCKNFNEDVVREFSENWFQGKTVNSYLLTRK